MISVVIVNHNTREHLRACLETVMRETAGEVLVVDNASNDGSVDLVRAEFPSVGIIANDTNPGYGAAANQAIAACQAPYILLLNSDTRLQSGALSALSDYLVHHPHAAIVGPRLVSPDGSLQRSCYSFPTPFQVFLEESTLGRHLAAIPVLSDFYLRTWSHGHRRIVPWVLGAALAIRREAFDSIGGFDPSFFMYAEEVDLCYRLREAGWQTHFTPDTTIIHEGGASTRQRRAKMAVQFFLSLNYFYKRHYSKLQQAQLNLILRFIIFGRLIRDSIRFRLAPEKQQRDRIAEDVAAWKYILLNKGAFNWVKGT